MLSKFEYYSYVVQIKVNESLGKKIKKETKKITFMFISLLSHKLITYKEL